MSDINRSTETRLYRKKPLVIEAVRLPLKGNFNEVYEFLVDRCPSWVMGQTFVTISTLEGDMRVERGDWVIRGVKGEFYPCKHDIFEATYEQV